MDSQQCQVCGQVFINVSLVMSHISSHSRKEIYDCLVLLKSSLEIFMKQYFSLKEFVNTNLILDKNRVLINGNCENFNSMTRSPSHHQQYHTENTNTHENILQNRGEKFHHEPKENNKKQWEEFVDLTEVEIKTEIIDNDDLDPHLSEMSVYNNFHSLDKGDNLIPQNGKGDNFNSRCEMTSNQKTRNVPVSVVDLSQGLQDQEIQEVKKMSEGFEIKYSNTKPNNHMVIHSSMNDKNNTAVNHKSQVSNVKIGNNKDFTSIKQVGQLAGKTFQKFVQGIHDNLDRSSQNNAENSCSECGRIFATKFVLRRHMMSHTGERTHACPICGKGFIGKQNMMVHVRVHTGEKPYKCSVCGQQFSQYGTLYRHKKRHLASGEVRNTNMASL